MEFDVVSVRQNKTGAKPSSNFSLDSGNIFTIPGKDDVFGPTGGVFEASAQPLLNYINFAYKLSGTQYLALRFKEFIGQAANIPDWVNGERFDIQARADGNPTKDQMRRMMQALLVDRFKLAVHTEKREVPVFGLVRVKSGSSLRRHSDTQPCSGADALPRMPAVSGVIARVAPSAPGRTSFGGCDVPLELLAGALPTQTGMNTVSRPVLDETGMTGTYDFAMEWTLDSATDVTGPSFQEALRDQLGFKLAPEKGKVEVLVIDHVEQPTAN